MLFRSFCFFCIGIFCRGSRWLCLRLFIRSIGCLLFFHRLCRCRLCPRFLYRTALCRSCISISVCRLLFAFYHTGNNKNQYNKPKNQTCHHAISFLSNFSYSIAYLQESWYTVLKFDLIEFWRLLCLPKQEIIFHRCR